MVRRLRLIHWDAALARTRASELRAAGYRVTASPLRDGSDVRDLTKETFDAAVIDLTRLPMQGRDVGLALRKALTTRRVPIVFADGEPAKVERVRRALPDAHFTSWARIRSSLKRAIAAPPSAPRVPASALEGYSGTPLPKKLGIKPGSVVGLLAAPDGFERTLGSLPEGASLRRGARGRCDPVVWFVRTRAELDRGLARRARAIGDGGSLWIAWPKKSSGTRSDLTQAMVRSAGLAAGLVDFKIAAIDATWSGLRFARRR